MTSTLRTPSMVTLMVITFVSNLSVFLIVPYFAWYLGAERGLSVELIGAYLALTYWFLRGGGVLGGMLALKLGTSRVMTLGLLLRAGGYPLFLLGSHPAVLVTACIVTSLGGAFFFPTSKAAIVQLTEGPARLRALSVRNMCANAGVALGPVVGAVVLEMNADALFIVSGVVFLVLAAASTRVRSPEAEVLPPNVLREGVRALRLPGVMAVCLAWALFGAVYIALESTIPLYVSEVGRRDLLVWVFVINAILVVLIQPLATKLLLRTPGSRFALIGFASFAAGFLVLGLPASVAQFWLAGIALFTVGEVTVSLLLDYMIGHHWPRSSSPIFGMASLADAGGGAVGSMAGASLMAGYAAAGQAARFWPIIAVSTLVIGAWAALLLRRMSRAASAQTDQETEVRQGAAV